MLLNVLKGAYPSLQQISKDHLIATDTAFERGSCLVETTSNGVTTWKVAGTTDATDPAAIVHFSLHGAYKNVDDYQTLMAGKLSTTGYTPRVSALSCLQPMEIETDMFTEEVGSELAPGDYLTVGANGKLVKRTATTQNAYLQVTQASHARWANNADASGVGGDWRQGNNVNVITGRTVFIPAVAAG